MPTDFVDPTSDVRCSLVVLNFNKVDLLRDCLSSLAAASGAADEIIVVDNGSSDGSAAMVEAEFPGVRVVALPENTYIFGLNEGVRVARGDYVAFLNNDMTVEPGFVESLVAGFDADDVFAVCARILDKEGGEQGSRTASYWKHGTLHYRSLPHVEGPSDCFFAVGGQSLFRRTFLDEIGSIDPLLRPMYHEDIELSYRAWKRGWVIRYAPEAVVHHLGSQTTSGVFTDVALRAVIRQNEFLIIWKDITSRRLLASHLAYVPIRLLKAVVTGDRATLRGFVSALRRIGPLLRARRRAAAHFRLSDEEVLALTSEAVIERSARATPLPST